MQREQRKEHRNLSRPPVPATNYSSGSSATVGFEYLRYGSKIALLNLRSYKYVAAYPDQAEASADGCHPGIYAKDLPHKPREELIIRNFQNRESTDVVQSSRYVCLQTSDGHYLVFNGAGELKVEYNENYNENNNISRLAKWTIVDVRVDKSSKAFIKNNSVVAFKQAFNNYMVLLGNGLLGANAPNVTEESSFKIVRADCTPTPEWFFSRKFLHPSLNSNYLIDSHPQVTMHHLKKPEPLVNFNLAEQECKLIQDFINAMLGHDGTYIRKKRVDSSNARLAAIPSIVYAIEPFQRQATCDYSLFELLSQLLPILNAHETINDFIVRHGLPEYGLVNQALAEELDNIMRNYHLLVVQLDTEFRLGNLTLQKMKHYLSETKILMSAFQELALDAHGLKGGALLSLIYEHYAKSVQSSVKSDLARLLQQAAVPFVEILYMWIYRGELVDQKEEFLIMEDMQHRSRDNIDKNYNDEFWNKRFQLRAPMVPVFMKHYAQSILVTGKYLNVMRECECEMKINCPFEVEQTPASLCSCIFLSEREGNKLGKVIEHAYNWASDRLNQLFVKEFHLFERLHSLKRYFFHQQGDFIAHFLDVASNLLDEKVKQVHSVQKLTSILEMVVRTTTANNDPFKDDLTCQISNFQLSQQVYAMQNFAGGVAPLNKEAYSPVQSVAQILVYETFTLDYKVRWPLTLILSRKSLAKYQLIFRHLLIFKYVEQKLGEVWKNDQSLKELQVASKLASGYHIRHKMLHFCKNCIYYMTVEVLEPKWHTLMLELREAQTLDQMLVKHDAFLDDCLKECLITDQDLLNTLKMITGTCLFFCKIVSRFHNTIISDQRLLSVHHGEDEAPFSNMLEERKARLRKEAFITATMIGEQNYETMMKDFEEKLEKHMKNLVIKANQKYEGGMVEEHLLNMLARLDYNSYYSRVFGRSEIEDLGEEEGASDEETGYGFHGPSA